jgi:hypothetical protein
MVIRWRRGDRAEVIEKQKRSHALARRSRQQAPHLEAAAQVFFVRI